MRKYIIFVMLAGLVLSSPLARAEDSEDSASLKSRRADFKEETKTRRETFVSGLKENREAFMAELKTRKEAWKTTRSEMKLKFCEKVNEIITKRFSTVLTQLEKFQTRVADKIEELKDAEEDTTLATAALNLSKSKLADAKAKLLEIKGLVPDNCTKITPEIFAKIKLGAREAKDLLKESRESLHQAVEEIKNLKDDNESEEGDAL